ncbi:MAG: GGDEF domain-containing protein [Burkholderiaceae bacterium]|nr:GGDEF domain-containing protein [Roseateles sp.]MBV8471432.1 GGDEF domain-containing protein [Burkholderiaceae bacterium]
MRYTESKARSAELLRLALGKMGQHDAAFNPVTFTVWYEYVAGINIKLSNDLDLRLKEFPKLGDGAVLDLYQSHIAPTDADRMMQIGQEMQRVMHGISESASHTGTQAGNFGAQLTELTQALAREPSDLLGSQVLRLLEGTAEMKQSVAALQGRVMAGQEEIDRLRDDLARTRREMTLDPLTGLLNRKGFDEGLRAMLAEPPSEGSSHCLLILDIDHFKQVNDTHGHLIGDKVIQGLSEVLRRSVTTPLHSVARYGGEEFAVVLPNTTMHDANALAETIRSRAKGMKFRRRDSQDVLLAVTVSGGIAAHVDGDDEATLIARADAAMYASKRAGRDRVTMA